MGGPTDNYFKQIEQALAQLAVQEENLPGYTKEAFIELSTPPKPIELLQQQFCKLRLYRTAAQQTIADIKSTYFPELSTANNLVPPQDRRENDFEQLGTLLSELVTAASSSDEETHSPSHSPVRVTKPVNPPIQAVSIEEPNQQLLHVEESLRAFDRQIQDEEAFKAELTQQLGNINQDFIQEQVNNFSTNLTRKYDSELKNYQIEIADMRNTVTKLETQLQPHAPAKNNDIYGSRELSNPQAKKQQLLGVLKLIDRTQLAFVGIEKSLITEQARVERLFLGDLEGLQRGYRSVLVRLFRDRATEARTIQQALPEKLQQVAKLASILAANNAMSKKIQAKLDVLAQITPVPLQENGTTAVTNCQLNQYVDNITQSINTFQLELTGYINLSSSFRYALAEEQADKTAGIMHFSRALAQKESIVTERIKYCEKLLHSSAQYNVESLLTGPGIQLVELVKEQHQAVDKEFTERLAVGKQLQDLRIRAEDFIRQCNKRLNIDENDGLTVAPPRITQADIQAAADAASSTASTPSAGSSSGSSPDFSPGSSPSSESSGSPSPTRRGLVSSVVGLGTGAVRLGVGVGKRTARSISSIVTAPKTPKQQALAKIEKNKQALAALKEKYHWDCVFLEISEDDIGGLLAPIFSDYERQYTKREDQIVQMQDNVDAQAFQSFIKITHNEKEIESRVTQALSLNHKRQITDKLTRLSTQMNGCIEAVQDLKDVYLSQLSNTDTVARDKLQAVFQKTEDQLNGHLATIRSINVNDGQLPSFKVIEQLAQFPEVDQESLRTQSDHIISCNGHYHVLSELQSKQDTVYLSAFKSFKSKLQDNRHTSFNNFSKVIDESEFNQVFQTLFDGHYAEQTCQRQQQCRLVNSFWENEQPLKVVPMTVQYPDAETMQQAFDNARDQTSTKSQMMALQKFDTVLTAVFFIAEKYTAFLEQVNASHCQTQEDYLAVKPTIDVAYMELFQFFLRKLDNPSVIMTETFFNEFSNMLTEKETSIINSIAQSQQQVAHTVADGVGNQQRTVRTPLTTLGQRS